MTLLEQLSKKSLEDQPREKEIVAFVKAGLATPGGKAMKPRLELARATYEKYGARVEYSSGLVWITDRGCFSPFSSFYLLSIETAIVAAPGCNGNGEEPCFCVDHMGK